MTPPRTRRSLWPGLLAGLLFLFGVSQTLPARAQRIPTGSGSGYGTGMESGGARSTGTGAESLYPGSTGTGSESGSGGQLPGSDNFSPIPRGPIPRRSGSSVPRGPGAGVTFPDESDIIPLDLLDQTPRAPGNTAADQSTVTEMQLKYARRIPAAGDRSLALSRIASAATFSNQLDMADHALVDSADAALQMTPGMVQDQRLISIITALMGLAEARLREGRTESIAFEAPAGGNEGNRTGPSPAPVPAPAAIPRIDRSRLIRTAQTDWRKASQLAQEIGNPTYRSEMMYRVADSIGFGSQSIVNEFSRGGEPAGAKSGKDAKGLERSFEGLPDQLLQEAADLAARIERPVWHDQALFKVATSAAESRQYSRATNVARMIPQPEVRTNALLKIAELQARRDDPNGATPTYREAALSVAAIPQDDPRAVLTGVLVDSLISVGRFEDARASLVLYPDEPRRMVAMGAIAESQGRRGAALSAMQWINTSAPPQYRSWLYRKVNNGVVAAIEDNRRHDLNTRDR